MKIVLCPVCEGRGRVPMGFYYDNPQTSGTLGYEPCRRCLGVGTLTVDDDQKLKEDKAE